MNLDSKKLIHLIKQARYVFIAGNGGSAATAEHFTNDLFSKGIKAICLNSNVSIMTMIANDFGYEFVFSNQLDTYANEEDLLITISCSGTSANIINAQCVAKQKDMQLFEFESFKGSNRDFGKLENKHLKLVHEVRGML